MTKCWFLLLLVIPTTLSITSDNLRGICHSEGYNLIGHGDHRVQMTVDHPSSGCHYDLQTSPNVNMYQVMSLHSYHFPQHFSFNHTFYPTLGRMVECIHGICNKDPYYWMIYNGTTDQLLDKGIDETYPDTDTLLVWKYINVRTLSGNGTTEYWEGGNEVVQETPVTTGNCVRSHSGPSQSYITVTLSAVDDRDPSWPGTVCSLPVMAEFGSTLGQVLAKANEQHRKKFSYSTDVDETHRTYVKSINDLENEEGWNWLVYDPVTLKLLPTGLDDTLPHNNAAYLWRFTNETHEQNCIETGLTGWTILSSFLSLFTNVVDTLFDF